MLKKANYQPVDASVTPRYSDVATFLRARRHDLSSDIDIGLCGVPFDLGVNFRSGPRDGPAGVREASRLIRRIHPVSGIKPYDLCNVADIGDAPTNPLDKDDFLSRISEILRRSASRRHPPHRNRRRSHDSTADPPRHRGRQAGWHSSIRFCMPTHSTACAGPRSITQPS